MNQLKTLSTFALIMMTVVSVDSVRNLPASALFGSHVIGYYLLAMLFFLIPCALASAYLSSKYPEGGIYVWVQQTLGKNWALFAIWCQWIENVIWFPTLLSFLIGSFFFTFFPHWTHHSGMITIGIILLFGGMTWLNWYGVQFSAKLSVWCAWIGSLIPMLLVIFLAGFWCLLGYPSQISISLHDIVPTFSTQNMVSLAAIALSFCGVELVAVHGSEIDQPEKKLPKALLIASLVIGLTLLFGSLAIAVVLPAHKISLVAGLMQAFYAFFDAFGLTSILPLLMFMIFLGGMGSIVNWIIAPVKGLQLAAADGYLPAIFSQQNKNRVPTHLLLVQFTLVLLIAFIFQLSKTINASYWILTVVAAQFYMMMYVLMFVACLKTPGAKNVKRSVSVLAKFLAIFGIIGSVFIFIISFIPPTDIVETSKMAFILEISCMLVGLTVPVLLLIFYRKSQRGHINHG
jgi:amino acid transporter